MSNDPQALANEVVESFKELLDNDLRQAIGEHQFQALNGMVVEAIAKFLYIGRSRIGPGTLAALTFLILFYVSPLGTSSMPFLLSSIFILGCWTAGYVEKKEGVDPGSVVIDEVFGILVAIAFLPKSIAIYAIAFVLFRVLDIAKPFPIALIQKIPGGLGIMADDLAAGLLANVMVRLLLFFVPLM